jgi:hypothetical protein
MALTIKKAGAISFALQSTPSRAGQAAHHPAMKRYEQPDLPPRRPVCTPWEPAELLTNTDNCWLRAFSMRCNSAGR